MPQTPPRRGGRSLAANISTAFLALGLAVISLAGWIAFRIAEDALETATYERLTGIRETKKRQIETYFRDVLAIVGTLARSEPVTDALLGFEAARLPPARQEDFEAVRHLHHETLTGFAQTFGFEDLSLIAAGSGVVLYTAAGGPEAGVQLASGPYAATNLASAFRQAMTGAVAVADFAPYPADDGPPAAFVAAPISANGAVAGVLAARLSVKRIDEVMTGGANWQREGLGETGETYLVGSDHLMRSDSRFEIERPDEYFGQLRQQGYPPEVLRLIQANGTAILAQRVDTEAVRRARAGEAATSRITDYRGVAVLSSFTPLKLPGLDWVLLSEIDEDEAFAPARRLRDQLRGLALLVSGVFLLAGLFFARRIARPLLALTAEVERLGREGLREGLDLIPFQKADDEVERLARSFGELTDRLQATLVSRDYLDNLLASMIDAVLVLTGVEPEPGRAAAPVVRSANPAACRLLGYREEELSGRPLGEILGSRTGEPYWMDRLRRERQLPPIEKELVTSDGRRIPVLFTAAYVHGGPEPGHDVVCVARDITERKSVESELEANRQELRVLAGRLLTAQEEERSRLARELHDDVTQRLAVLAIEAGKAGRQPDLGEEARTRIDNVKDQAIRLSHDIQGLSRRLHPSILDDLGLAAALRAECQSLSERLGVPVSFAAEELPPDFPREVALALYRIAQECFRNISRHARASEVNVEMSVLDGTVRLRIEDDGAGFDAKQARRGVGLGLVSMEERIRLMGGKLAIRSEPGRGAKIEAEVPIPAAQP